MLRCLKMAKNYTLLANYQRLPLERFYLNIDLVVQTFGSSKRVVSGNMLQNGVVCNSPRQ